MEKITKSNLLIGKGIFNWSRYERVSDRYGAFSLLEDVIDDKQIKLIRYDGFGILNVKIIETRESTHIGDMFRGFSPTIPEVGEEIVLGRGNIFYYTLVYDGEVCEYVGVKPDNTSKKDWLDPNELYKCHEQTVEAYFSRISDALPQISISENMNP